MEQISLKVALCTFTGGYLPSVKPNLRLSVKDVEACFEKGRLGLVSGKCPLVDS